MGELMNFTFESHEVRTVIVDGEPWFVAKDVCDVLEIGNPTMAVSRLDDDEKALISIEGTNLGNVPLNCVSESGLYSLVIGSRKPEAKAFKRWITHDVIPQIRKTGSYGTPRMLTRLELIDMARESELARIEAEKQLVESQERNIEYQAQLQAQAPKVLFADAVTTSHDCILLRELAVLLKQNGVNIGQNRLFEELRERGYLIKRRGSDWNTPTQRSMELGLFQLKETPIVHSDGTVKVSKTTKVTGKGQAYFINLFKQKAVIEV